MTVFLRSDTKGKTEPWPLERVPGDYLKGKDAVDDGPAQPQGLPSAATLSAGFRQGPESADSSSADSSSGSGRPVFSRGDEPRSDS